MGILDYSIIIAYIVAVFWIGAKMGRKNQTGDDYFTAGRSLPWYAIGVSIGATFISANTFIGGPGWTYTDGIITAMINFGVPLGLLFATYTILPIIYNSRVTTIFEYYYMRFGSWTRLTIVATDMICSYFPAG